MHPLAITLILAVITCLAERSRRLSSFIRRGIIHFICFLLLPSYTSVATTSLLLIRPLTFHNVDKIYTYLSPDIEYFHGRHLAYGIIAIAIGYYTGCNWSFISLIVWAIPKSQDKLCKNKAITWSVSGMLQTQVICYFAAYYSCTWFFDYSGNCIIMNVNSFNDFTTLLNYHSVYNCNGFCVSTIKTIYWNEYFNLFNGDIMH